MNFVSSIEKSIARGVDGYISSKVLEFEMTSASLYDLAIKVMRLLPISYVPTYPSQGARGINIHHWLRHCLNSPYERPASLLIGQES
jgi:hypothetical protein